MHIKHLYGPAFHNLLIFPEDWHTLKNYQPVLIKVYYSAGLEQLAKSSGYRGQTLSSLKAWSNFKQTHCFRLHVWEALYREMLHTYFTHNDQLNLLEAAKYILSSAIEQSRSPVQVMKQIEELIDDTNFHVKVAEFAEQRANFDDTWMFWKQFIFVDCYAYVGLYLTIRGSNWKLRV